MKSLSAVFLDVVTRKGNSCTCTIFYFLAAKTDSLQESTADMTRQKRTDSAFSGSIANTSEHIWLQTSRSNSDKAHLLDFQTSWRNHGHHEGIRTGHSWKHHEASCQKPWHGSCYTFGPKQCPNAASQGEGAPLFWFRLELCSTLFQQYRQDRALETAQCHLWVWAHRFEGNDRSPVHPQMEVCCGIKGQIGWPPGRCFSSPSHHQWGPGPALWAGDRWN